jgi:hypothetical protein
MAHQKFETLGNTPCELESGDKVVACCGLWAVSVSSPADFDNCHTCGRRTFRVVTIATATGPERKMPLCGRHFLNVAIQFAELNHVETAGNLMMPALL